MINKRLRSSLKLGIMAALLAAIALSTSCQSVTESVVAEEPKESSVTPQNPEAVLASIDKLQKDTLEAATHNRSKSKISYIGAWASSANQCKDIDTSVYDGFTIITPTSLRQFEQGCIIRATPIQSGKKTLDAACRAEGTNFKVTYSIEMKNSETLILQAGRAPATEFYRCNLPS